MKYRLLYMLLLLLAPQVMTAQNYEYWLDSDYAGRVSKYGELGEVSFEMDVSTLYPGIHYLNCRARQKNAVSTDSYDAWGSIKRTMFYVIDTKNSEQPVRVEYWLDSDYAGRVSEATSGGAVAIEKSLSELTSGIHYLNVRSLGAAGQWGSVKRTMFYVDHSVKSFANVRCWIDEDPATAVTQKVEGNTVSLSIDISELSGGDHTLYVQGQGSDGGFGDISSFAFETDSIVNNEPYAVLSDSNTVLTFYYDNQKEARDGMSIDDELWYEQRESITTAIFDPSFANCTSITSTAFWFYECKNLTSITGVQYLRTDNVTDMNSMFGGCSSLTSLDLSGFKTDNVTSMHFMFDGCSGLTSLDLSGFKTDNVWIIQGMFHECSGLTTLDLSSFNTQNVTIMGGMFSGCSALTTIYAGSGWSTAKVEDSSDMFGRCRKLVGGAGTAFDIDHLDHTYAHIDGGPDNPGYFTRSGDAPYTEPELYAVLEENMNANSMVDAAPNRAATAKTYTMKFYYDGKKTERNGMSVETYREATTREWDNMAESITNVVFDLTVVNDTAITSTGYWFSGFTQLTSIEGLNYLNTSHVADTWAMFEKCSSLKEVNLSNFDTRNVKTMGLMFYGCENLLNLDVSSFNTANVTHTNSMFANCIGLTSLDLSGFNTRKVENMSEMFLNCTHLTTIYAGSDWSTESSAGGGKMFGSCYSLVGGMGTTYDENHVDGTYAHIDGGPDNPGYFTAVADTVTVDDDIIQFADANVKAICVSNWDASGDGELSKTEAAAVTTIGTIFKGNTTIGSFNELKYFTGLESLSNSAFEKSTVTSLELPDGLREIGSDAFSQCRQLKSIYIPATVSKMGSDRGMAEFWLCYNLETIVVDENNKFYTSVDNVLFNKEMTKIIRYPAAKPDAAYEIPNTVSAINQNCFESCSYLMAVYIPASVNEMGYGAFQQCSKLVKVTISDGVTMIGEDAFRSCESLDRIHIPASVKQIGDERNSPENVFFWSSALAEITVDENNPYFMSEGGILYSRDKSIIVAYPPALTASEFAVPYGVQKISSCCFTGTKNLTSIQIPETVIAYGSAAINLSDNTLQSLTVMATTPATIEDYAFSDAAYSATLYVPVGTVQAYRNANGWKLFQNIVEQSNVPVDYSFDYNGVLTVGGSATLADALSAAGGREEVAKTISAIVWNSTASLTNSDLQGLDNPNMLIYVKKASQAPDRDNVVVGQELFDEAGNYIFDDDGNIRVQWFAKNIMLSDVTEGNGNFYCPQAFTAEAISYTREFRQETQVGVSRGWEAIALPFDVQTIMHEKQGMIAPFGNSASNKHFWLRRLSSNGLVSADKIEANVPYLISMPNNSEAYYAEYNLSGKVTFTAQDVTVPVTAPVTLAKADSTIKMVPAFQSIGRSSDVWAINVGETRGQYYEGSVFERDYREVRPFEAYTIHRSDTPAPRFVPIMDIGGTTGIEDVRSQMSDGRGENCYDLQGRKVANGKLPRGVYIRNGKKTVVR